VDGPVLHYFDFTMLPYFELIAHIDDEGEYSGKEGKHLFDPIGSLIRTDQLREWYINVSCVILPLAAQSIGLCMASHQSADDLALWVNDVVRDVDALLGVDIVYSIRNVAQK
jgi:hypothetical protein